MVDKHTVRSYDEDLKGLNKAIIRMGDLAQERFSQSVDALLDRNSVKASEIIVGDAELDALELDINTRAIRLLALRQPMADDLRYIVSAFKISSDLERIGDYAANIGKRVLVLNRLPENEAISLICGMVQTAQKILHDTMQAFATRDSEKATTAWHLDKELDKRYEALLNAVSESMQTHHDPLQIGAASHIIFIAKNIERIGDHATNIAEKIYFFISGFPLRMVRGEDDSL